MWELGTSNAMAIAILFDIQWKKKCVGHTSNFATLMFYWIYFFINLDVLYFHTYTTNISLFDTEEQTINCLSRNSSCNVSGPGLKTVPRGLVVDSCPHIYKIGSPERSL